MTRQISFEEAWRAYLQGPSGLETYGEQDRLLRRCLEAATTIDQTVQIFNAAHDATYSEGVRSPALQKMISFVQTADEAKRVYAFASRRGRHGFFFPAREREARAKLESLASA